MSDIEEQIHLALYENGEDIESLEYDEDIFTVILEEDYK